MNISEILEYYSREDVSKAIFNGSQGREVAWAFPTGSYGKRPNILQYASDTAHIAKQGATSFHFSVERWKHPMQVRDRTGWDIILDMDSKIGIDGARITAIMICELLEKYGIRNYGIKFSGSRGFHIALPWVMFPKEIDYKPLAGMYPDVPRIIASFIREKISAKLMQELIKEKGARQLLDILEETPETLDPFYFVDLEKSWGNRHMFRAPYSLNEKTWLASVPLSISQLKNFTTALAEPAKIKAAEYEQFFKGEENEALNLLTDAMDWNAAHKKEEKKAAPKNNIRWEKKISEEYFPPCMKNMLKGLTDGKKRSMFTLPNFLRMMNWTQQEVEEKIVEWNEKNRPPMPRTVLISMMRWDMYNYRTPANCNGDGRKTSENFYGFVCEPDKTCRKIKNPLTYPFKKNRDAFIKSSYKAFAGFKCGVCDKAFKNMKSLRIHKGRMHGISD